LKEEAVDRTIWRARFGRDFGPVVKDRLLNEWTILWDHPRICDPSLTETSFCGAYLYSVTSAVPWFQDCE